MCVSRPPKKPLNLHDNWETWELVYKNESVHTKTMCEIFEIEFDGESGQKIFEFDEDERQNLAIYSPANILIWVEFGTRKTENVNDCTYLLFFWLFCLIRRRNTT